jgi:hypothetical protein
MLEDNKIIASLITVAGVIVSVIASWSAIIIARRLEEKSIKTAIRSDIRSIVKSLEIMGIVDSFIKTFESPRDKPEYPSWTNSPGKEDYFKMFGAIAPQIGKVPPPLAKEIVRFYTFLRISRDAAQPISDLRKIQNPDGKHSDHIKNSLLALRELLEAAETALSAKYSPTGNDEGAKDAKNLREKIDTALRIKQR